MNWIRIRSAKPDDIDAIMAVERSSFSLSWSRGDLERDIADNILSYYIVAESVAPRGEAEWPSRDDKEQPRHFCSMPESKRKMSTVPRNEVERFPLEDIEQSCCPGATPRFKSEASSGSRDDSEVYPYSAESRNNCKINVVGYAGIWVVEDECHIMTIAVAPERRNAGIGAMLLMKLLEEARLRGASRFFLEVRVSNVPAIAMYEKFGFRSIDIRKRYYEDNHEDAAVMYKVETSNLVK